jgi:outer membrane protein OmpA-like peptidoglycan-associated protein
MARVTSSRAALTAFAAALAAACAGERAAGPATSPPASEVLRTTDLSRIRCVLLAPLENGSDSPSAAKAATAALGDAVDPRRATVLPVKELRATFQRTTMELPAGIGPPLALDLADLLGADASLSGAVDGRSTGPSAELVVSIRLASTADRAVLFARTVVVRPVPGERAEDAVHREVLAAAGQAFAEIGNAAPRRCFDPAQLAQVRSLATREASSPQAPPPPAGALPAPPPPPSPVSPPLAAKPPPLGDRQASWARRLAAGERVVIEDVSFAGRSAQLDRATGLEDLTSALAALPDGRIRLEGFVDATSDGPGDGQLSRAMAQAVADRLAALGVAPARLAPSGRGGDQPVVPNFTARGRTTNRRVEALLQR